MAVLLSYSECTTTDATGAEVCINTAQADRTVLDSIWCCQGVVDNSTTCYPEDAGTGLLEVTAPAGGSPMSVTVADGRAIVEGRTDVYQGAYHVIHTATEEYSGGCSTPDQGARIDAVVLVVNDDTLDASGKCGAEIRVLCNTDQIAGSATPTAMTDAQISAATGSDAWIRLANVTVEQMGTAYTTVQDTRPYAKQCSAKVPKEVRFTADGTFHKADYPGAVGFRVRAIGGGGGGGGAAGTHVTGTQVAAGAGGGGGAYAERVIDYGDIAGSVNVNVGNGGTGGLGNNPGDNGTASTFAAATPGSEVVAPGGKGGQGMQQIGDGNPSQDSVPGGLGGDASQGKGAYRAGGQDGSNGYAFDTGGTPVSISGNGGSAAGDGGGGGKGGVFGSDGQPGNNRGGGGGGGHSRDDQDPHKGGNGAGGIVLVEVLY